MKEVVRKKEREERRRKEERRRERVVKVVDQVGSPIRNWIVRLLGLSMFL